MEQIERLLSLMREYLFPVGCGICGGMLLDTEETWYGLCGDCRNLFTIEQENRCSLCGKPLISEINRCLQCRTGETHYFDRLAVLFPYTGNYRKLLRAYKFDRRLALGNLLAEKILEGILRLMTPIPAAPVLVPVPPRPGKLKHTGWDQIAYIAALLSKAYRRKVSPRLPVYQCLKRLPSKSQKELSKENRKTNLLGRIRCTRKVPKEVIVFDDVITTGFTLDACAAALKEGGAEKVYGVCLFYT